MESHLQSQWTHDTKTRGIAVRALRRVKEKQSKRSINVAYLITGGTAMECCCYLRNVHDKTADGRRTYDKTLGVTSDGPLVPLEENVSHTPISSKKRGKAASIWRKHAHLNIPGI